MDETMIAETLPEADAFESGEEGAFFPETERNDLSGGAAGTEESEDDGRRLAGFDREPDEGKPSLFDSEEEAGAENGERPAVTIPVKYNKQYRELTPEQATVYAQKGMKYESLEPSLNKLKYLAAASGKSLADVVERLYAASDEMLMQKLLQRTGGDKALADTLFRAEKEKHGKAYTSVLMSEQRAASAERFDTNNRLAGEFLELQKEFPELGSFDKVPEAVAKNAALKGTSLFSEYLLYRHREERRASDAIRRQKAAGEASLGKQGGSAGDGSSQQIEAMRRGVWQG